MGYYETALMAADEDLNLRITACASLERIPAPELFVLQRKWEVVGRTDWAEAYSYAVAKQTPNPGRDAAVITDAMILASVQAVRKTTGS